MAFYRDKTAGTYPLTLTDVRGRVPFLFGPIPTAATLTTANVDAVTEVTPPTYDATTQRLREGTPVLDGAVWKQVWVVEPRTETRLTNAENRLTALESKQTPASGG